MKSLLLSSAGEQRQWVLVMDAGDEAMAQLVRFASRNRLAAAHFTGIGALSRATVAWFDLRTKRYMPVEIPDQVEVLSLVGDVARYRGRPAVHAHICVARRDGSAHGGHLQSATVEPTLEVILSEAPAHLSKTFRPEFGLPLIDIRRKAGAVAPARRRPKPSKKE